MYVTIGTTAAGTCAGATHTATTRTACAASTAAAATHWHVQLRGGRRGGEKRARRIRVAAAAVCYTRIG